LKLPWHKVWFNWLVAIIMCALSLYAGVAWGKAADCRPKDIDGQCGLITFLGFCYGAFAGCLILLFALCRTLYLFFERRRANSAQNPPLPPNPLQ